MSVMLSAVIATDGSPQEIKVDSGTLGDAMNGKAIEALSTWHFAPAMLGDQPVATRINVPFSIEPRLPSAPKVRFAALEQMKAFMHDG
jgi:TonB family protein